MPLTKTRPKLVTAASDPGKAVAGDIYFNTYYDELRQYNGTSWRPLQPKKPHEPSVMSDAYFWLKAEGIVFGADGIVDRWDEANNNRDFTPDVAPSSNSSNVYAFPYSNGYLACSADDAYNGIGSYGPCLRYNTNAGYSYNQDFSCVMAISHLGNGGLPYNDAFAAVNPASSDGAFSLGPGKSHTWGGSYGEVPNSGGNGFGTGVVFSKSYWFTTFDASDTRYKQWRWDGGSKSWVSQLNASGGNFPNLTYTSHTVLNFEHASNSSHYARGHMAEYAWWQDTVLTDAQRDEVGLYLHDKFRVD